MGVSLALGFPPDLIQQAASAPVTLESLLLGITGAVAYWPLTDTTGTTVDNAEGTAALDGTYALNYMLANTAFVHAESTNVVTLTTAAGGRVTFPGAAVDSVFDWTKGFYLFFVKNQSVTSGLDRTLIFFKRSLSEMVYFRHIENGTRTGAPSLKIGNVTRSLSAGIMRTEWNMVIVTWDTTTGVATLYSDGVFWISINTLVAPTANPASGEAAQIGGGYSNNYRGDVGHVVLGAGAYPTESEVETLYNNLFPAARSIHVAGDSKSNDNDHWQSVVVDTLQATTGDVWRVAPRLMAVAGYKASDLYTLVAANVPGMVSSKAPEAILINIGINDCTHDTVEADFKTALRGILDVYQARWAAVPIYLAYPYSTPGATSTPNVVTLKGWINDVMAEYSGVFPGHDENVWFANNIATYSDDGTHYNLAGAAACAAEWVTVLGY